MEFHGRKIIIEEAKTPPRTLVNELYTNAVANDQQNMHKMPPTINDVKSSLPTAPTEEQIPIQNINSIFQCSYTKEEKHCTFFGQYTSKDENETSKFPAEGMKNTLTSIRKK